MKTLAIIKMKNMVKIMGIITWPIMTMLTGADEPGGGGDRSVTKLDCLASQVSLDKPARLIIRLLFGFVSDSVFVKLIQKFNQY